MAVLDEQEAAARPQHPAHLGERPRGVGNAAQRPAGDDGVDAGGIERNRFRRAFEQIDRRRGAMAAVARHREEVRRRLETDHVFGGGNARGVRRRALLQ